MSDFPWDDWRPFPVNPIGELTTPNETKLDEPPPLVTVFGAGISGLSAAHELIERGFGVQVVESEESETEEYECRVGGMAANQLSRVPASLQELHLDLFTSDPAGDLPKLRFMRARRMRPTQRRFPVRERIVFDRANSDWLSLEDEHKVKNCAKLNQVLNVLHEAYDTYAADYEAALQAAAEAAKIDLLNPLPWTPPSPDAACREILLVEIRGYTDCDETSKANRDTSHDWATAVLEQLDYLNATSPDPIPDLRDHLVVVALGDTEPIGDQRTELGRARSNRVEFRIVEQVIPGEHGFRFFPSFYRHLFDAMRRTPVLDEHGNETGETAYDRLIPTRDAQVALADGEAPYDLNTRRIRSLTQLQHILDVLCRKMKFTNRDILCLQLGMFRYMTSCRARRENEAEDCSFWDWLGGDAAGFSPRATQFIKEAPKALAAMSGTETDARTQCTLLLQLLFKSPFDPDIDDNTLNASTADAWLTVWKRYLQEKGVRFFVGRLDAITRANPTAPFLPSVSGPPGWMHPRPEDARDGFIDPERSDFFVLALPFEAASELVWKAHATLPAPPAIPAAEFDGPFGELMKFDVKAQRRDGKYGNELPRMRDPDTGKPAATDPLRDIAGIQYFFPNNYRIGRGNVYFFDAEWGLTAISQLAYWRERTDPIGAFIGQNSVDIGDWYKADVSLGRTAWYATAQEIAESTWRQVKRGLRTPVSDSIIDPRYYHLDRGLVFVDGALTGFLGSALLNVAAVEEGTTYSLGLSINGAPAETIQYRPQIANRVVAAQEISALINRARDGSFAFAVPVAPDLTQILISPFTAKKKGQFVLSLRGESARPFYIKAQGRVGEYHGSRDEVLDRLFSHAEGLTGVSVQRIGPFTLLLESDELLAVAVANADDMIEIVDGAQIEVTVENRGLQVTRQPVRSSSRTEKAVAVNHVLLEAPDPEPGRRYRVELRRVGADPDARVTAERVGRHGETKIDVCEALANSLNAVHGITARVEWSPNEPLTQPAWLSITLAPVAPALDSIFNITSDNLAVSMLVATLPSSNGSPFLINVPGQWEARSALYRKELPNGQGSVVIPEGARTEFRYWHDNPLLDRWTIAGTFMATHTRMTTMEAANESARHAVNAILHKIVRMPINKAKAYGFKGRLIADPCEIWDPEENELDDFGYFKELDAKLCAEGLPHFTQMLCFAEILQSMPDNDVVRIELWDEIWELMAEAKVGAGTLADAYQGLFAQLKAAFGVT